MLTKKKRKTTDWLERDHKSKHERNKFQSIKTTRHNLVQTTHRLERYEQEY